MRAIRRCGWVVLMLAACSGGTSKAPHAPSTSDAQLDGGASKGHGGHTQHQADSGSPDSTHDAATTHEHTDAGGSTSRDAATPRDAGRDASSAIDTLPWHGSTTPLAAGSWHKEQRIDQGSSAGGFGSASYSPTGDLYAFYSAIAAPETLFVVRRASGQDAWSSAAQVAPNGRTSHATFIGDTVYAAIENHGTALVYQSADQGDSWNWEVSFSAKDNNAETAYGQAFLIESGGDLALYFGYMVFDAVVGSEKRNPHRATKHRSDWSADATSIAASTLVQDVQGAYADAKHHVLVLAADVFRSDDDGQTFAQLEPTELTGIVAATRNDDDASVMLANQRAEGSRYALTLWGTRDLGASFSRLTTLTRGTSYGKVALAATQNRAVVAITTDQGHGDSLISVATSTDEGATWSDWNDLVDVTAAGDQLSTISLTAAASGNIALVYSVEHDGTRKGVFLRELE
jgi:hypothetical protein